MKSMYVVITCEASRSGRSPLASSTDATRVKLLARAGSSADSSAVYRRPSLLGTVIVSRLSKGGLQDADHDMSAAAATFLLLDSDR